MTITIQAYQPSHIPEMTNIWNEVVKDGIAFPQTEPLSIPEATEFFAQQTHTAVALDQETGEVLGLYILHPNNVGRCGHIANASYAVASCHRGKHVGTQLVKDSLRQAKNYGFQIMQFNAVVKSNQYARHLYEKLGFIPLGIIPQGFHMKDGHFEDICLYYFPLSSLSEAL